MATEANILAQSWDEISSGYGRLSPPDEILRLVFPTETRERWAARTNSNIEWRLDVLAACGSYPANRMEAGRVRCFRAQKAAWDAYLFTAFACGMLEGERGADLFGRLRSTDDDDFRAALAECLACWFLAGRMRFPLDPRATGRNGRNLDMRTLVEGREVGVEVKAPYRERPLKGGWTGGESDKIIQVMDSANRQFRDDQPNILIVVPELRVPMYQSRADLFRAAYGSSVLSVPINLENDDEAGEPYETFVPRGRFLNTKRPDGKLLKPDGLPGFRRISMLISIEEILVERYPFPNPWMLYNEEKSHELWPYWLEAKRLHYSEGNRAWVEHRVVILHNPNTLHPIPPAPWAAFPQFVSEDETLKWTDGQPVVL